MTQHIVFACEHFATLGTGDHLAGIAVHRDHVTSQCLLPGMALPACGAGVGVDALVALHVSAPGVAAGEAPLALAALVWGVAAGGGGGHANL